MMLFNHSLRIFILNSFDVPCAGTIIRSVSEISFLSAKILSFSHATCLSIALKLLVLKQSRRLNILSGCQPPVDEVVDFSIPTLIVLCPASCYYTSICQWSATILMNHTKGLIYRSPYRSIRLLFVVEPILAGL